MSNRSSGWISTAAAAVLAMSGGQAMAQDINVSPIKIGVIDYKGDKLTYDEPGVSIQYREFNETEYKSASFETPGGEDHGRVVVTAAVRELRRLDSTAPIEVFAANPSVMDVRKNRVAYAMQYEQAAKALEWMHGHGVRVVVTAFNTKSEEGSKIIMDKAESLGMTVFAGVSNKRDAGRVLPAADPRAISLADTTPGKSSLTLDTSVDDWVMFAMRGEVSLKKQGETIDNGASYASAMAGAYGAYYQWKNPDAKRDEIAGALSRHSEMKQYNAGSVRVQVATLGEGTMPAQFVRYSNVIAAQRQLSMGLRKPGLEAVNPGLAMAARGFEAGR